MRYDNKRKAKFLKIISYSIFALAIVCFILLFNRTHYAYPGSYKTVRKLSHELFLKLAATGNGKFIIISSDSEKIPVFERVEVVGTGKVSWRGLINDKRRRRIMRCDIKIPDILINEPVILIGYLSVDCTYAERYTGYSPNEYINKTLTVDSIIFPIKIIPINDKLKQRIITILLSFGMFSFIIAILLINKANKFRNT